ncbi:MAG: glycosyltransferase family 1 protein [Deltaproteobacteria bacterium]|nr:glycosyltransferase family 1 protein [Deltaproteobacteria bacterium]
MRIAFEAKRFFTNRTGLGNYARSTVHNLRRLDSSLECILYTPRIEGPFASFAESMGCQACVPHGLDATMNGSFWRTFGLGRVAARDQADLFHGLSHELPLDIGRFPGPSVVTVHDLIFLRRPDDYPWLDRTMYRLKYVGSAKRADRIVAVSRKTADDLVELLGIPEDRISVVHQSCKAEFMIPPSLEARRAIRDSLKIPESYALFVGSLTRRKNPLVLVDALALMPSSIRPCLILVGSGPLASEIRTRVSARRLEKNVFLLKNVEDDQLPALYAGASVFVYPSFYEGFGIPILEALWSRVPVVAATGSCLKEAGGPGSIYVSPDSAEEMAAALKRVLTDSELAANMVRAGLEHAATFTPEASARNLMEVYRGLLS